MPNTIGTQLFFLTNTATTAIAGSSAGMAILGDTDYTGEYGSATNPDALADPDNRYLTRFETAFLDELSGVITDTHFSSVRHGRREDSLGSPRRRKLPSW